MYRPLSDWFAAIPANTNEVRLTFGKIEEIIKDKLPQSARRRDQWWRDRGADTRHSQSLAWLENGWHVKALNRALEEVTFTRQPES
jgi:hypothetical protein